MGHPGGLARCRRLCNSRGFAFPCRADELFDDRGGGHGEGGAEADDFFAPVEFFEEVGMRREGLFAVRGGDEDVDVFIAWRDGDEDLAADPEGREVEMRLLGHLFEGHGKTADLGEC